MSTETSANTPNLIRSHVVAPDPDALLARAATDPVRVAMLYGSLRQRSYSRFTIVEAQRVLESFGADTRIFDPAGLPLPDGADSSHPRVKELRSLVEWCQAMVWCSPERHGAMSAVMKAQIDWIPLSTGALRPTQGKTLAVMQVCGGSQSFNAVNQLRILGRWMRFLTVSNQSSIPRVYQEFDGDGLMRPSSYHDRVVDVMEELMKITVLTRDRRAWIVDRYSERKATAT